jgi:hypothetical protein
MNQIAYSLGMDLSIFRARDAVMRPSQQQRCPAGGSTHHSLADRHQDSLLCLANVSKRSKLPLLSSSSSIALAASKDDDDTVSTMYSIDEEESFSSSSSSSCSSALSVSFADPLVTHVYERPSTTLAEKFVLYYADLEYRKFKRDYVHTKRSRSGGPTVHFSDDLVSSVHEYDAGSEGTKDDLFYNDSDLQRFLDEFVASLNDSLLSP